MSEAPIHSLTELTVEHLSDPLGVATARPRFGWRIESAAENLLQHAYELVVTTGDRSVWESGRVEAADGAGVEYAGPELASRTRYDWRVRSWLHGRTAPSAWAEATFETSLLHTADWQARWVVPEQEPTLLERYSLAGALSGVEAPTTPPDARLRPPLHLRQRFSAAGGVRRARLYATARGVYEAELNGRVVGDEVLAPGFDSYPHRLSFQTYDVSELLTEGVNVLGLTVADGWWAGRIGLTGSSANYGDRLAAIWQLEIEYLDGSVTTVASGGDVRASVGPRRYADLFVGEHYDATRELTGWSTPAFDDDGWRPVTAEDGGLGVLTPFAGEPVRRTREFRPERVLTTPAGDTVVDLGQVIAGRLRIAVSAPRGTEITLEHSEVLTADGDYFSNILGPNKDQTDHYVAAGRPGEVFEPAFTFHGFRYVRLTGLPQLRVEDVTAVVIGSDLRETSRFTTSDPRIDRLHQNVLWSQRANFLSIPTDCPQRERAGWTGDLQVFAPAAATNMDVRQFVERWLANLRADQLEDGQVPIIVPVIPTIAQDGDTGIGTTSAGWSDAVVIVPWVLYERYGDARPLRENYPAMTRWVEHQMREAGAALPQRLADRDLAPEQEARQRLLWNTGFHFGDWLAPSTLLDAPMPDAVMIAPQRTGELVAAMFHAHSLRLVAEIAAILGHADDAARYRDRFERVRAAFAQEYVDPDGRLPVEMQGLYVVALAFGLVPDDRRAAALAHLVALIHDNDDHLDTGFVSVPYLLDVLWDGGERDLARRLLRQDTVPSWLYAVDRGATTIWEAWAAIAPDGTVSPMSMNHYAFGCVDDWMFRRIAGLQPVEPGYRRSRIEPDLDAAVDAVRAGHHTPHGLLSIDWHRSGDTVSVEVTVPHGTVADLVLRDTVERLGSGRHQRSVVHPRAQGPSQVESRSTTV